MRDDSFPLRPLSIGEIFDRGITVYVRKFVPLALISLAAVLPLTVLQYMMAGANSASYREIAAILQQVQHPAKTAHIPDAAYPPGWIWLAIILMSIAVPYAVAGVGVALARAYEGREPDWRSCYADVFRRWASLLGALFLGAMIFLAVAVAGWIGFFILTFMAILTVRTAVALGIVLLVLIVLFTIAWFVILLMAELGIGFALFSVVLENLGFAQAVGRAFERLFNRAEFLKAAGVAASLGAMYIGLTVVSGGLAMVGYFVLHSSLFSALVTGAATFVQISLLSLLAAVYYFDVRVRRDGLDLQAALTQLQPAT